MALTIRTLSDNAEYTLVKMIENNEHINTNTKAIEYVLENYLLTIAALGMSGRRSQNLKKI